MPSGLVPRGWKLNRVDGWFKAALDPQLGYRSAGLRLHRVWVHSIARAVDSSALPKTLSEARVRNIVEGELARVLHLHRLGVVISSQE